MSVEAIKVRLEGLSDQLAQLRLGGVGGGL